MVCYKGRLFVGDPFCLSTKSPFIYTETVINWPIRINRFKESHRDLIFPPLILVLCDELPWRCILGTFQEIRNNISCFYVSTLYTWDFGVTQCLLCGVPRWFRREYHPYPTSSTTLCRFRFFRTRLPYLRLHKFLYLDTDCLTHTVTLKCLDGGQRTTDLITVRVSVPNGLDFIFRIHTQVSTAAGPSPRNIIKSRYRLSQYDSYKEIHVHSVP